MPHEPLETCAVGDKVWWPYQTGYLRGETQYAAAVVTKVYRTRAKIRLYSIRGGTTLDKIVPIEKLSRRRISNTLVDGEND